MKAIVFHEYGETDVLQYTDVEEPSPGPGEVKIAVSACALNHLDIWIRLGKRPIQIPMPHILGCDVAGSVAAVGDGVEDIELGTSVIAAPVYPAAIENIATATTIVPATDSTFTDFKPKAATRNILSFPHET